MIFQPLAMMIRKVLVIAGVFCLVLTGGVFSHSELQLVTEHEHIHIGAELAGLADNHAHMGDTPSKREASGILHCDSKVLAWFGKAYFVNPKASLAKQRAQMAARRGFVRSPDPPPPRFLV